MVFDLPCEDKVLRVKGLPRGTEARDIFAFFGPFTVCQLVHLADSGEALVYFMWAKAERVVKEHSGNLFNKAVKLDMAISNVPEFLEAKKTGKWTYLFEIIAKGKGEAFSARDLEEAVEAGIFPKEMAPSPWRP